MFFEFQSMPAEVVWMAVFGQGRQITSALLYRPTTPVLLRHQTLTWIRSWSLTWIQNWIPWTCPSMFIPWVRNEELEF